jgi:hypothetical protein
VAVCAQRLVDAAALQRTYPTYNGTVVGPTGSNVSSERPTAAFCPHDGRRAELHRARGAYLRRSGHRRYRQGAMIRALAPDAACLLAVRRRADLREVGHSPARLERQPHAGAGGAVRLLPLGLRAAAWGAQAYGFGTMQFSTVAGSANPSRLHYQVRGDGGGHGDAPTRARSCPRSS